MANWLLERTAFLERKWIEKLLSPNFTLEYFARVCDECTPEELSMIKHQQCQKIKSMPRNELFSYIRHNFMMHDHTPEYHHTVYQFGLIFPHLPFPEILVDTVKSITDCVQSRLQGKFPILHFNSNCNHYRSNHIYTR